MRRNVSQTDETQLDAGQPPRPTRAQRLVAWGFLAAFGLTIITVLLTGLKVGAPAGPRTSEQTPPAAPRPAAVAPSSAAEEAPADARAPQIEPRANAPDDGEEAGKKSTQAKELRDPEGPAR